MLLSIFNILAAKCLPLKYWSGQPSARRNITRGTDIENQDQQENYQEFLLSLVCLRLGLFEVFFADLFGVSNSSWVFQIFIIWITFVFNVFGSFMKLTSLRQVKFFMPLSFRKQYPYSRAVIDCTEYFLQRPISHQTSGSYIQYT